MPHPDPSSKGEGLFGSASSSFPHRHDLFTPERRVQFLSWLAEEGNVRGACARVGVSAQAVYLARRRDRAFAAGWAAALVLAREQVEQVLADRALNGVEEQVFYRGDVIATRRRFDTRLLLAHLARLDARAGEDLPARHAARFDELLAVVGGAAVPPEMLEPERLDLNGERIGAQARDTVLPVAREDFCFAAYERAARAVYDDIRWAPEPAEMVIDGDEPEDEAAAAPQPWEVAALDARARAAALWDGWHARMQDVAARMVPDGPGEMEFKSRGGPLQSPSRLREGLGVGQSGMAAGVFGREGRLLDGVLAHPRPLPQAVGEKKGAILPQAGGGKKAVIFPELAGRKAPLPCQRCQPAASAPRRNRRTR